MRKKEFTIIILSALTLTTSFVNVHYLLAQNMPISNYWSFEKITTNNLSKSNFVNNQEIKTQEEKEETLHVEKPENVKGIYMSSWVAGTKSVRNRLTNLVNDTVINSVVIDFKDSTGVVSIPAPEGASQDRINAESTRAVDLKEYIQELHENDVYVIARIAVFEDPIYAKNNPTSAVLNSKGELWKDRHGLAWVDASSPEFHQYILELAYEAYDLGFDEINLDYIRFPTDGSRDKVYPITKNKLKQDVISDFTIFMHKNLKEKDIPLSIDVFGQILTDPNDVNIGQFYEYLLPNVDAIAPMIYPSHFYAGYKGLKSPEANPYQTIKLSLQDGLNRQKAINNNTEIRPWLQDFSMSVSYGPNEVKAQIKAANDVGIYSYLLWDPKNRYTKEALLEDQNN